MKITNNGGLLTSGDACLGYLFHAEGHGTFEPDKGRVPISKEDAAKHNECLALAELKGLDENCEVGQGGCFYWFSKTGEVKTWTGLVVSKVITKRGKSLTFTRNGKTFRGTLRKDFDMFSFRRIA